MTSTDLGRLVSVHRVKPAYLQRGVFIAALSLLFFLVTMFMFYTGFGLAYFLLATAFLTIYLITLFSVFRLRRNELQIYERGFRFRERSVAWPMVIDVNQSGTITIEGGKPLILPRSLQNLVDALEYIRRSAGG